MGWADVATKHDLVRLEEVTRSEFVAVRGEMKGMRGELMAAIEGLRADTQAALRQQTMTFVAAATALMGVLVAVLKLT